MMPDNKQDYNFVERTQENLRQVSALMNEKQVKQNDFYDFTNLINNCLGLISYVYEYSVRMHITLKRKERIQEVLGDATFDVEKYGKITLCKSMDKKIKKEQRDMPTLLYHMRNAICHGHFEPYTTSNNNIIAGATFWDENNKKKNFEIVMTIAEISEYADDIAETYNNYIRKNN